jgi:hypothetical protein
MHPEAPGKFGYGRIRFESGNVQIRNGGTTFALFSAVQLARAARSKRGFGYEDHMVQWKGEQVSFWRAGILSGVVESNA